MRPSLLGFAFVVRGIVVISNAHVGSIPHLLFTVTFSITVRLFFFDFFYHFQCHFYCCYFVLVACVIGIGVVFISYWQLDLTFLLFFMLFDILFLCL